MALHEIIYVSLAPRSMPLPELLLLLDQARANNVASGITGLLVYHKREFLQLIEGEEAAVHALFDAIAADPRHQQIHKVWDGPITQRSFADWSMGFVAPDDALLRHRPGYQPLREHGLAATARDSTGKKMLMQMRDDFLCTG